MLGTLHTCVSIRPPSFQPTKSIFHDHPCPALTIVEQMILSGDTGVLYVWLHQPGKKGICRISQYISNGTSTFPILRDQSGKVGFYDGYNALPV